MPPVAVRVSSRDNLMRWALPLYRVATYWFRVRYPMPGKSYRFYLSIVTFTDNFAPS